MAVCATRAGRRGKRQGRLQLVPPEPTDHAASRGILLDSLLQRVAAGDEDAFGALYDAVAPTVFGLARRIVRQPQQAEEVTQEVLLEVWQRAAQFDRSLGAASSWIMTLAHRRSVDRVRSAQAATDREKRQAATDVPTAFDEVVEAVEQQMEADQVRRCLESLTQIQRESVTLAYYEGHTYPEVAALLGAPLGTVKTRMRDGLIRLRDCLGVSA